MQQKQILCSQVGFTALEWLMRCLNSVYNHKGENKKILMKTLKL